MMFFSVLLFMASIDVLQSFRYVINFGGTSSSYSCYRGILAGYKMELKVTSSDLAISTTSIENISGDRVHHHWTDAAALHQSAMENMLYPPGESMKARVHMVKSHPIYNFLHTYYRYSVTEVCRYSPGMDIDIPSSAVSNQDYSIFSDKYVKKSIDGFKYNPFPEVLSSRRDWNRLSQNYEILLQTSMRQPHFGCFGYHEWAMLYSGRIDATASRLPAHQGFLKLRVSQDIIDDVVEAGALKCTHFDAWRFFHPIAQTMNNPSQLTRQQQQEWEQPGCIHASMDLFKYGYQIYPLISSSLLQDCLRVAMKARRIDMRASPYDVSEYEECDEGPIAVETAEGKKAYILEQESLFQYASTIRLQLLQAYKYVIDAAPSLSSLTA